MIDNIILNTSAFGQLTDEQFFDFCQQNRDLRIERTANGEIIIMTPTGGITGNRNNEISRQLANWNVQYKKGVTFDSSAGFTLPDTSVRSPDASWISKERWERLTREEQEKFPPLCPDFVIELRSKHDNLPELQNKMKDWMNNGCQLAWLIDPENQQVFIYKQEGLAKTISGFDNTLSGENILQGFSFDLKLLQQ
jgi:Uma2 family endonuclease